MRKFEVLFDDAEPPAISHPAYAPYGKLGFPPPHAERPWTYANFVQSIDGIASFKGKRATGGDIAQSMEDSWLMHLLRAHADAIITGINTLVEETRALPNLNSGRGPVYLVNEPDLLDLRQKLGLGRQKIIFVTASARIDPAAYRVFDGDLVDAFILTTSSGATRFAGTNARVLIGGDGELVDLPQAMRMLRLDLGVRYLLCEGGPTLYGNMSRSRLIDEKFVTVSPVEIGLIVPPDQEPSENEKSSPSPFRPTTFTAPGFTRENAPWYHWMSCRRCGDHGFNRYRRTS